MFVAKLLIALMIMLSSIAEAQEKQRLYRSAHYLGRGDTGIATADNHEAIFYNPAGLARGKGIYKETVIASPMVEISADTKDLIRKVAIEKDTDPETMRQHIGKNQHLGIYNFSGIVFRRAAVGAAVSTQNNVLVSKDPEGAGLEQIQADSTVNQVLTFSIAEKFFKDYLMIGTTLKYINRGVADAQLSIMDAQNVNDTLQAEDVVGYGNGGGADIGLMFRTKGKAPFSLGLTVEDVGDTIIKPVQETTVLKDLESTVNIGLAVEPGTKFSKFKFFIDYRDLAGNAEQNPFKRFHFGTELSIRDRIGFTAGSNQGYPTVGTYIDLWVLRLDVGAYGEEMGDRIGSRPDQRYFMRLVAGF